MNERYYSLDVFRGATVALMILVNNPGDWNHIYAPFEHASWNGATPTDLVFPFFLFAIGNAMSFVIPRYAASNRSAFLKKTFKRSVFIFCIGLLLNWSPFFRWQDDQLIFKSFHDIRILGVLQRIALCYLFASLIAYHFKKRGILYISGTILITYWIASYFAGNHTDPYSLEGFWGTRIDRAVLGYNHIYKGEGVAFDPEGLISTIPTIPQVLIGYIAGSYIQQKGKTFEMLSNLFFAGALLLFLGYCWNIIFPFNKKIWSSSFVVYSSGVALVLLAVMIRIIEFGQFKKFPTAFFAVFGKNPLFIFVLSGFLPRVLGLVRIPSDIGAPNSNPYLSPYGWFYKNICLRVFTNMNNSPLLFALCMVLFYWFICYCLDKKKLYFKV